jgi:hypothetical protein
MSVGRRLNQLRENAEGNYYQSHATGAARNYLNVTMDAL